MRSLQARTSDGTSIREVFAGTTIKRSIADEKPRCGGVSLEFADCSFVHVWFEVVELEGWEVTAALRVTRNFSRDKARGFDRQVGQEDGIVVSGVSLIYADLRLADTDMAVANGMILFGSEGETITIVSSSGAGTVALGFDVTLEALESEYPSASYRLESL